MRCWSSRELSSQLNPEAINTLRSFFCAIEKVAEWTGG